MTTKIYKVYSGTIENKNPRIMISNMLLGMYKFQQGDKIKVTFDNGKIVIVKLEGN